jgi:hypothetical protein
MNGDVFVIILVAIVMVAGIIKQYLRNKHDVDPTLKDLDQQRLAKIEDLERRIEALETIVTDKSYELNREFETL